MPTGSADCESNDERIQTEADCRAALDVLAPSCSSSKWSGDNLGIPRCCSERPGHCGSSDWHWNSASTTSCDTQVGSGRSDTTPICKRGGTHSTSLRSAPYASLRRSICQYEQIHHAFSPASCLPSSAPSSTYALSFCLHHRCYVCT